MGRLSASNAAQRYVVPIPVRCERGNPTALVDLSGHANAQTGVPAPIHLQAPSAARTPRNDVATTWSGRLSAGTQLLLDAGQPNQSGVEQVDVDVGLGPRRADQYTGLVHRDEPPRAPPAEFSKRTSTSRARLQQFGGKFGHGRVTQPV